MFSLWSGYSYSGLINRGGVSFHEVHRHLKRIDVRRSQEKRADQQFKFGGAFVMATMCKPIVSDKESAKAEALQKLRKHFGTVAEPRKTFDVAVVPTGPDTHVYLAVALKSEEKSEETSREIAEAEELD